MDDYFPSMLRALLITLRDTLLRWWRTPKIRRTALLSVLGVTVFGAALLAGAWMRACSGNRCPSIEGLDTYDPDQASKVYAADGRLITDLGKERRTVLSLQEMSPALVAAFLATEDKRFYQHHGIDWIRFFGAVKANILAGGVSEGFSTITMQLARNLFPEDLNRRERSLDRKIREARVATEIEARYSKDKILELYLNQIDLGNRAFGVEAASQRYFGKSSRDLNVAEAASLAAIPKSPSRYNPRRHPARALQRRNLVIGLLAAQGTITEQEAQRWKAYPLLLSSRDDFSGVAEYFVEYIRQQLDARFGPRLYTDGLRIYTTLDLDIQQSAERALEAQLSAIEAGTYGPYRHQTYADYIEKKAERDDESEHTVSPYLQGLTVTLEAKTGYILAMVGGRDFEDSKFNRATQALRQPGSTFKPIVYTAGVRAGVPLTTVMVDEPITVEMPGSQPPWEPQNYDNTFRGPMPLRQALYQSVNIIAIKLGMEIGEEAVIAEGTRFGLVASPIPAVPSIHLGSALVKPLEMIAAYTAFANQGERATPMGILRVEDRQGNILWQPKPRLDPVMDPPLAWMMNGALQDVVRRGTGTRAAAGLNFPIGGKTGTTNDGFDVWFIGYTSDLVAGFWFGLDNPDKIKPNAQGGILAAPAWRQMMEEVYERRSTPGGWPQPDGLVSVEIDRTTGFRASPYCPTAVRGMEWFLPGSEPNEACPVHLPFGQSTAVDAAPIEPAPTEP
ncbi:MAG TPA: PBP1A family penicillin-binding protein [Gemmatimonadales bacterium]|nr:PBP1A family penicillin-binding protein [Gemmatimonadales bacterium]